MCLDIGYTDLIGKLIYYKGDVQEELLLIEIELKKLKISEERINTIRLQCVGDNFANYLIF